MAKRHVSGIRGITFARQTTQTCRQESRQFRWWSCWHTSCQLIAQRSAIDHSRQVLQPSYNKKIKSDIRHIWRTMTDFYSFTFAYTLTNYYVVFLLYQFLCIFWPTSASTALPHHTWPSLMCRHRRKPVVHGCDRLRRIHASCHGLAHATETGTSL